MSQSWFACHSLAYIFVDLTGSVVERVRGQQFETMHLEERRVEEELAGGGPELGVLVDAALDEVLLALVLQVLDRPLDDLVRDPGRGRREGRRDRSLLLLSI